MPPGARQMISRLIGVDTREYAHGDISFTSWGCLLLSGYLSISSQMCFLHFWGMKRYRQCANEPKNRIPCSSAWCNELKFAKAASVDESDVFPRLDAQWRMMTITLVLQI